MCFITFWKSRNSLAVNGLKAIPCIFLVPACLLKKRIKVAQLTVCVVIYSVCQGFRLNKASLLFLSHVWPLLKQVVFFEAAGQ